MKKALILIVAIGVVLRIWGIGFGLPYQFHQDEPIVVNHAFAYGTGDLNPHFFAIPPLTSYILFFVYMLYFILGKVFGLFGNPGLFALAFFKDPSVFYLLGRIFIGLIPGTLCVIFTWALYKKIFSSESGALFAAAVMSFSFLNVVNSHYIYADMLMLMFVILSMISIFNMHRLPSMKNYVIAAITMGCAIATKYNAALIIIPFFIAHLLICKSRPIDKNLIIGAILMVTAFFMLNPFALIDFGFFINSILKQGGAEAFTGWTHHIRYSLYESIGPIILILGFLGMIVITAKDVGKWAILFSFPMLFYLHILFFGQQYSRYVLPLTPFLALGSGFMLFEFILPGIGNRSIKRFCSIAFFLIFIPLIVKDGRADLLLASKDTRVEAAEWINKNVTVNNRIAVDHSFFRPSIYQNKEQLMQKIPANDSLKAKKIELMIKALEGKKSYYLYFLERDPGQEGRFMSMMPVLPLDMDILKKNDIGYVAINYANRQQDTEGFYTDLKDKAVLVASFSPYRDKNVRMPYDRTETTGLPVLSKELYSRIRPGPAIEIYELKR